MKNNYLKFGLMMACSFTFMYIAMFFNVDQLNHIFLSQTRAFMALYMVGPMAIMMLLFMLSMYKNRKVNAIIISLALLITFGSIYLLRTQSTVKDIQYMKAMIPHHSIAILVSNNANLKDPETKQLAKEIIKAQEREIAQMKRIISRLEKSTNE